jgi:HEAT repeat protein
MGCSGSTPSLNSSDADLRRLEIINLSDSSGAAKHFEDFIVLLEKDPDYLVRAQSAVALGKLKNNQAIPVLLKALHDSNQWVRLDVINALGEINDPTAIPALHKTLTEDNSPDVRRTTARILGKIGAQESIDVLIKALEDRDSGVAENSYQSLRQITKQNIPKNIKEWEKWRSGGIK